MLTASIAAAVIGAGAPAPVTCPEGAREKERVTPDAREIWCETDQGVRHGPRQAFYRDGARWFVGEYDDSRRSGEWRFWYPSGAPMSVGTYRADKRHGKSEHFHDGAGLATAGECKAGVEVGLWTRWYPNGEKEVEIVFGPGGEPGKRTYYSRRGKAMDLKPWVAEKVRGAAPDSERYQQAWRRYASERFFTECGN